MAEGNKTNPASATIVERVAELLEVADLSSDGFWHAALFEVHKQSLAITAERDEAVRERDAAQKANRELAEHIVNLNLRVQDLEDLIGE